MEIFKRAIIKEKNCRNPFDCIRDSYIQFVMWEKIESQNKPLFGAFHDYNRIRNPQ